MPTVQLSEQETKDLAKKAGGKALELGKKGLATGKQALNEVHKAGMFELKNFKEYNSSLVHMINTVKGEVTSVQGGQRTAQDAVVSALTFKSNDPEGGFKFMCERHTSPLRFRRARVSHAPPDCSAGTRWPCGWRCSEASFRCCLVLPEARSSFRLLAPT